MCRVKQKLEDFKSQMSCKRCLNKDFWQSFIINIYVLTIGLMWYDCVKNDNNNNNNNNTYMVIKMIVVCFSCKKNYSDVRFSPS